MKIKTGRKKLDEFIGQADKDNDAYLLVHFSKVEDRYRAYYYSLDHGDALLIIKGLCAEFNLSPEAIAKYY